MVRGQKVGRGRNIEVVRRGALPSYGGSQGLPRRIGPIRLGGGACGLPLELTRTHTSTPDNSSVGHYGTPDGDLIGKNPCFFWLFRQNM